MIRRLTLFLFVQVFLLCFLQAQEETPIFKVVLENGKVLRGEMVIQDQLGLLILRDPSGVEHHIPRHQVRKITRLEHPRSLREEDKSWMVTPGLGGGTNGRQNLFLADLSGGYRFRPWLNLSVGAGLYAYQGQDYQRVLPVFAEWRAHWWSNPRMPYTVLRAGIGFGGGGGASLMDDGFFESRDYDPGLMINAALGWQIGQLGRAPLLLEGGYLGQRLNYTAFLNDWWIWPPQEPESYRVHQYLQRWMLRMAVVF